MNRMSTSTVHSISRVQVLRASRQKKLRHRRTPPGHHNDVTIQSAVHPEQRGVLFMAVIPYGDEDLAIPLEVIRVAHNHRLSRLCRQRMHVGQIFELERLPNRHL